MRLWSQWEGTDDKLSHSQPRRVLLASTLSKFMTLSRSGAKSRSLSLLAISLMCEGTVQLLIQTSIPMDFTLICQLLLGTFQPRYPTPHPMVVCSLALCLIYLHPYPSDGWIHATIRAPYYCALDMIVHDIGTSWAHYHHGQISNRMAISSHSASANSTVRKAMYIIQSRDANGLFRLGTLSSNLLGLVTRLFCAEKHSEMRTIALTIQHTGSRSTSGLFRGLTPSILTS